MKMKIIIFALLCFFTNLAMAAPLVYVPLGSGNSVIAVDAAADKIIATYPGVENAHGLVATPNGEYLIAGSLNEEPLKPGEKQDAPNSKLYLIHPEHGHVMSTIPVAGWSHHLAISPDGRYVISTHPLRGNINVVDLKANKVIHTIKTGNIPNSAVITRDGNTAYVSNVGSNNIVKIDLKSWKVKQTLDSGPSPEHLVLSPNEKQLFVANAESGTVSTVSTDSGKVINTYEIATDVHGLDISDDGKTLFVSSKSENKFFAVNIKSGKKKTLNLDPSPYHLNTITGTGKVYVSSSQKPVIWVIDQKTNALIDTITFPAGQGHEMAIVK